MSNALPTLKLSAEFGVAPVGAEVRSWDWSEDEDGFRFRSEFDIIPDEAITVTSKWADRSDEIGHLRLDMAEATDPTLVVRFTVQTADAQSFTASTWMRFAEASELLTAFVESVR
jgi:hypothetical protein